MIKSKVRSGFSLLELMIVIIILGLLASLIMPNLIGKSEQAKSNLVCIQMKSLSDSLKMFKLDNGVYPTTDEGLKALMQNPDSSRYINYSKGGYIDSKKEPKDPWGTPFAYVNDGDGAFDIISLGPTRQENSDTEIHLSTCER